MKKTLLVLSIFALAASGMAQNPAPKATPAAPAKAEVFSTKILKVYEARSQEGVYVAYVVDWKGREVVVTSALTSKPLKVGDTVDCTMRTTAAPSGVGAKPALKFSINYRTSEAEQLAATKAAAQLHWDAGLSRIPLSNPADERPQEPLYPPAR